VSWTRNDFALWVRQPGGLVFVLIVASLFALSQFGVRAKWSFVVIAVAWTLWLALDRRMRDRSNRNYLLFGVAFWVFVAFAFSGVAGRWMFVAIAVVYTVWFIGDRGMHTRSNRSYAFYVIAFWAFGALAFAHLNLLWGFLALAIASVLFRLDQRRASGKRRVRPWPPPTAPSEAKRLYVYGDACLIGGIASFIAAFVSVSGFILFSFVLFATGAYLRFRARRVWKAADQQAGGGDKVR
jgi:hypothetical protein